MRTTLSDALSEWEFEVVRLTAEGLTAKEVGAKLGIGEMTACNYRIRAYHKLRINSLVQLTHWALATGVVENLFDDQGRKKAAAGETIRVAVPGSCPDGADCPSESPTMKPS